MIVPYFLSNFVAIESVKCDKSDPNRIVCQKRCVLFLKLSCAVGCVVFSVRMGSVSCRSVCVTMPMTVGTCQTRSAATSVPMDSTPVAMDAA